MENREDKNTDIELRSEEFQEVLGDIPRGYSVGGSQPWLRLLGYCSSAARYSITQKSFPRP